MKDKRFRFYEEDSVPNPDSRWWNLKPAYTTVSKEYCLRVDEEGYVYAEEVLEDNKEV